MIANEFELLGELEDELEEEAGELEVVLRPQGAAARKCDNRGIPEMEPVQAIGKVACTQDSAHHVADPLGVLKKLRVRAIQALESTISQLVTARRAVCELGAAPASQLSVIARCWLKHGLSVNTEDIRVWTAGTFEPIRSVAEVIRRLMRVRNLIASSGLRYSCTGVFCSSVDPWAYVTARGPDFNCLPGTPLMLIRLCRRFWIPATLDDGTKVPNDVHEDFQVRNIIHEASHLAHCTRDLRGRTIGAVECLSQFVAATSGLWLDSCYLDDCPGSKPCQPTGRAKVFRRMSPHRCLVLRRKV